MLLTRVRFPSPAPPSLGLLAQLVRALPSHGRGRWSESSTAHHIFRKTAPPAPFLCPDGSSEVCSLFARCSIRRPAGAFCSPWPWKVWRFAPARSVLCSPGAKAPSPCRGVGQRPTHSIIQSAKIPFESFVISNPFWQSCVR